MLSLSSPSGHALMLAALCNMLAGCGLTTRNDKPSGPIPDAGVDAEVDPGDPCAIRQPVPEPAANCAYPVAPIDNPPQLASVESLKRPNCVYQLGEAIPLPFDEGRYAFSFDVNGDQVGDVFFWTAAGMDLAVSRVEGGQLSYEPTSCDALSTISFSESTAFVRDLNADAMPDLVFGVGSYSNYHDKPDIEGDIRAFVNVPTGLVEVFRHDWPELFSKTSLLDVAVADFDGNGACVADMAFGYDRVFNETGGSADGVEWGGLVALMEGAEPPLTHHEQKWVYKTSVNNDPEYPIIDGQYVNPYGELAAGNGAGAPVWIGLVFGGANTAAADGILVRWEANDVVEQLVRLPPHSDVFDVWITPLWEMESTLVLLRDLHSRLEVYDLSNLARGMVAEHRVHTVVWDRSPGGGVRAFVRRMLDVDGDGEVDFAEVIQAGLDYYSLAIHQNDGTTFSDGVEFEVSPYMDTTAEHPFIAVGDAQAALVVNNASGEDGTGPPTVQPLECAP